MVPSRLSARPRARSGKRNFRESHAAAITKHKCRFARVMVHYRVGKAGGGAAKCGGCAWQLKVRHAIASIAAFGTFQRHPSVVAHTGERATSSGRANLVRLAEATTARAITIPR
jgi:hypothetical protein